ncbi:MAG TPA: energy-coupling factor transporter ATPase [Anaerovoracaceae bacterium]|nr:energy-coupling factor transporter ATPase [Anaerovoracaceae bacterium]
MATFTIKNLSFTYPGKDEPVLKNINLEVEYGEFMVVCGQTGCGKTTLLRNLKTTLAPHGKKEGEILFYGRPVESLDEREQAARIGYVLQNPDNQIVTDKVWHELAFGLESLGYDTKVIRLRVAEMANFFGIQSWFMKDISQLSGGQKQTLNLASVMAMQPDVLILDEPTSQLDPIAAADFLETVKKINREIGTTIIMTEHRLEDVFPMADRVVLMDDGEVMAVDIPGNVGKSLVRSNHPMLLAMPAPMQVYENIMHNHAGNGCREKIKNGKDSSPISVREGRTWLTNTFAGKELAKFDVKPIENQPSGEPLIKLKDVWFRYSREEADIIKDLSLEVYKGQLYCIVGGNGSGKTTALSIIGGLNKPYRGKVLVDGSDITKRNGRQITRNITILPQNPQTLFVEKTVYLDLMEVLENRKLENDEKIKAIDEIADLIEITDLLESHPYDLSGGEQQRAALAKVLLTAPKVLLLDEPTKGLDNHFKQKLAMIINRLLDRGVTIIMVSHDIEFCGSHGDICAMFFDGNIVTTNTPNRFFSGNSFYTTAANRMSRHIFNNAVTVEDVASLCKENLNILM